VTPMGKTRTGQCTRYLANLAPGSPVTVDIMPSVLRLPPTPQQPIVMAGLGTGMAPFRAFIQERKFQKESGIEVGPVVLYFGARYRAEEYLYGDELDAYAEEGLVTRLGLAFSRDQKQKVYIQHKIEEDGPLLKQLLGEQQGSFYLCGPTWPVPDVRDAIAKGMTPEKNNVPGQIIDTEVVEELKAQGRYVLEVY
jgi:sulfite reductase (NADPH) flavoprotein alpha-component